MVQVSARPKTEAVEAQEAHRAGYDDDFFLWTQEQAALLRDAAARGLDVPFDLENLAEEIESVGKRDRRGLGKRVARIIDHLLKLELSPAVEPRRGWRRSVIDQRDLVEAILADSPSLHVWLEDALAASYARGRLRAVGGLEGEVDEAAVPEACPYTLAQILDPDWWPEPQAPPQP